jgi:AraC-like DNA-binding protein
MRLFHEVFGETPFRQLTNRRIAVAQTLLAEGSLELSEIAWAVGYESLSAFGRAFRREAGTSPSSYRTRAAKANEQEL